jgi:hypothetical protein
MSIGVTKKYEKSCTKKCCADFSISKISIAIFKHPRWVKLGTVFSL